MSAVEFAVIAAAGLGSRLGHGMPKCMLDVGGQILLSRLVSSLRSHVRRIHVVTGYREELVINYCASFLRDVVIVRNPDYRITNTVQSMAMGSRGLNGKTIFLDGDLIIDPRSLEGFLSAASTSALVAAIGPARSENPVYASIGGGKIQSFSRVLPSRYEWANVFAGHPRILDGAAGFVYECLEAHLPLQAFELDLCEVDTEADLDLAKIYADELDSRG